MPTPAAATPKSTQIRTARVYSEGEGPPGPPRSRYAFSIIRSIARRALDAIGSSTRTS